MGTCQTGYSTDAWWGKAQFYDRETGRYLYTKDEKGERWINPAYESELPKRL